jgi:hypothetical protein
MGRMKLATPEPTGTQQAKPSTQFKPGQSGNPAGRPTGSRNKLCDGFLKTLEETWQKRGQEIIDKTIEENPSVIVNAIARLVPKEAHLELSGSTILELSIQQRTRIAESWLMSQNDRLDAIEGEAVRCDAALPGPDGESDDDQDDDDDDLDRIVPEREQEPVKMKQDDDLFERSDARQQHQPRPQRRAKIISTGGRRND